MIKLKPNPTFRFKIEVAVAGSTEPARFTLVGKHQGQGALRDWAEHAKDLDGKDAEFLLPWIEGWEDVHDEDGKAVKFSAETFAALLDNYPGSSLAIFQAYVRELSAARGKNL